MKLLINFSQGIAMKSLTLEAHGLVLNSCPSTEEVAAWV